jgi:DNA-directed RNA polymerase subunit RPC12/RpoP
MSDTIFVCENCGKKFNAETALNLDFNCDKCRDSIVTYYTDAAKCILRLEAELAACQARVKDHKTCNNCKHQGKLVEGFLCLASTKRGLHCVRYPLLPDVWEQRKDGKG